jgi:hypothetical protein
MWHPRFSQVWLGKNLLWPRGFKPRTSWDMQLINKHERTVQATTWGLTTFDTFGISVDGGADLGISPGRQGPAPSNQGLATRSQRMEGSVEYLRVGHMALTI